MRPPISTRRRGLRAVLSARPAWGLCLSSGFHLSLGVAALCLVVAHGSTRPGVGFDSESTDAPPIPMLEELATAAADASNIARLELPHAVIPAGGPPETVSVESTDPVDVDEAAFDETEAFQGGDLLKEVSLGSPGGGKGEGSGSAGQGGGDTFFGVPAMGRKIVYVVDCSGSMLAPHREASTRFRRLNLELHRAIEALAADRQFFVIFFNHESIPMPAKELQAADSSNKRKFLAWVDGIPADGETEPGDAVRYALRLKPDTIFLLTDGSFSPKTARLIAVLNRSRVVVHTLGFGEKNNESLLSGIARENGGTYRFVP